MSGWQRSADQLAGSLNVAQKKRLEMARALAAHPYLLLLDEVLAGLNHSEIDDMVQTVLKIREQGMTIMMIEHVMKAVMNVSDRIMVLDYGQQIAEGNPQEIVKNERVDRSLSRRSAPGRTADGGWINMAFLKFEILPPVMEKCRSCGGPSLSLQEKKLTCLVGGNGVGKTTMLRSIMGLLQPWKGTVWFEGRDVSRMPAYAKAEMGLTLVPEGRQLFTRHDRLGEPGNGFHQPPRPT